MRPSFELVHETINPTELRESLFDMSAGAFVSFEGWVRNHHQGQEVSGLQYSAHQTLAAAQGERVMAFALAQFPGVHARCVHRLGELALGEIAVWVGVGSAHRNQAFEACRFIIDTIKSEVPIWKQERYLVGTSTWLHPIDA
jgi:molybdopterin synthase catalytic subunit